MPKIHVLHENPDWLPPLAAALDRTGAPWDEWFLVEHAFDLSTPPPEGIFYNRMSASSHTRGHRFSPELTAARSEEHTSELQSLMRISYAVFCLKKKKSKTIIYKLTRSINKETRK